MTPGMVLTWKRPKAPSLKKMGRQVDRDFELEVLRECEKASNNHMQNGGSGKFYSLSCLFSHISFVLDQIFFCLGILFLVNPYFLFP